MSYAPPPIREPVGTKIWLDWFRELYRRTSTLSPGSGSGDLTVNGNLNLTGVLVGGQFSVSTNTTLTDDTRSVLVTATGKTMTLPAATSARVGGTWTIILGVAGYVDITVSGADTIVLPVTDDTIRLNNKGASVSLRCLTSSSWGIV